MQVIKTIVTLFLFFLISIYTIPELQADWRDVPDVGPGKCVSGCGPSGGYTPQPAGPTPEEIRRQREEKDLSEAAEDANDHGVEFYNKGDWGNAIKYFREALEYSPDNQDYRHNLQRAQQKASDAEAKRRQEEAERKQREALKSKALEEAQSNLYHTQQGKPGSVFDTPDANKSVPLVAVPAIGQPEQMSERVKNDPRMIKAQKDLKDIQTKRQKLDEQRTQLAIERNSATDPEKMKQLTKKLDKVEQDYQNNLLAEYKQKEKVEKLKRTIDAEVEKPVPSGQTSKGSGK